MKERAAAARCAASTVTNMLHSLVPQRLLSNFCCTMFCRLQTFKLACPAAAAAHFADDGDFQYMRGKFGFQPEADQQDGCVPHFEDHAHIRLEGCTAAMKNM